MSAISNYNKRKRPDGKDRIIILFFHDIHYLALPQIPIIERWINIVRQKKSIAIRLLKAR